ncbi:MAG TPA: DMT family transporter [Thermoanaerobaculaceae bacterium]|nr:DMT family transporter [Thermoanaerobaculaceae bacterium]
MKPRDAVELLVLAALWGGSFLFMRIAAPSFGPVPLIELRVGIAALALLPVAALRGGLGAIRRHAAAIAVVGTINSALPFSLLAFSTLSVTAGFASVLNATAPLFGAVVAFVWLRDRLSAVRVAGLAVGFGGVVVLVWGHASFKPGGSGMAVAAALVATLLHGIAANYAKKRLTAVDPLAIAAGSQVAAALVLAPVAAWEWPRANPPAGAWLAVVALALGCTAAAYILYFRLIAHVGPARAIAVTFLIPVFGIVWGVVFLGEAVTSQTLAGCAVILGGTALATGIVRPRVRRAPGADPVAAGAGPDGAS